MFESNTYAPAVSKKRLAVTRIFGAMLLSAVVATAPLAAQDQPVGSVANSAAGKAGQRQETDQNAANIDPIARLDTRIQNRVQSRIRNRIDRYYDPQANATSPFKVAADQARTAAPQSPH